MPGLQNKQACSLQKQIISIFSEVIIRHLIFFSEEIMRHLTVFWRNNKAHRRCGWVSLVSSFLLKKSSASLFLQKKRHFIWRINKACWRMPSACLVLLLFLQKKNQMPRYFSSETKACCIWWNNEAPWHIAQQSC